MELKFIYLNLPIPDDSSNEFYRQNKKLISLKKLLENRFHESKPNISFYRYFTDFTSFSKNQVSFQRTKQDYINCIINLCSFSLLSERNIKTTCLLNEKITVWQ